ncbi:MAG: hypothetical protein FWC64_09745 [Treponema sp.]|nr:hypothetical protein [Treponema sp.]
MEFLIDTFGDNIPSLIVIAVFLLAYALINNGYLSKFLKGRGKTKTIVDLIGQMDEICGKITALNEEVARLSRRIGYVEKSALMGNIYNDKLHVIDRLRAFDCYLRLAGNGLVAEFATNDLIIPNWNDWLRVQQENRMDIFCDKYHERIADINKARGE